MQTSNFQRNISSGLLAVKEMKLFFKMTPNAMNNLVPVASSPDSDFNYLPALRVQEIIAIWKESGLREILKNHINKR